MKIEHEGEVTTVTVKQTQATGAHGSPDTQLPVFAFDLAINLVFDDETRREVRHIDLASHTFSFRVPSRPRFVVIDPELAIVAETKLEAPGDMLRAQLVGAATARGRMLAAPALGRLDDPPSARALAEALAAEREFWGMRAEAAMALGSLRSGEAFAALKANAETAHPKVRRAVMNALGSFRTTEAADILRKHALKDESYLVESEAARALGATRQASGFDTLVDILDRPAWADVIRVGAVDGLANLRDERALPHIIARTRYGVSTRGRRAAIVALPKLAGDRKARETLEELLEGADPYLRVDVVRALADLGDVKARGALQRQLERDLDGRVRRRIREALRDLGGAGKRETDRLRDDLEALRAEHAEIKARLGKLEAIAPKPPAESDKRAEKKPSKQGRRK